MKNYNLNINAIICRSRHFLTVHHNTAVTSEKNDLLLRTCNLRTDSRWKTIAHGAQTARGNKLTRVACIEELSRPHLMLAYIGNSDGIIIYQLADSFNQLLWHDVVVALSPVKRIFLCILINDLIPLSKTALIILSRLINESTENWQ